MPIQDDLQAFLAEWHDPSPFLEVQTSGSTGTPKRMRVRKDRMLNSARLTCDYLGLKKGDKALLCMPLRYIAGKMMVVRSLYAGLDLEVREPSGHPLADWGDTPLRFAAMIPLQVYNTLRVPEERKRLEQTDILIIGGEIQILKFTTDICRKEANRAPVLKIMLDLPVFCSFDLDHQLV